MVAGVGAADGGRVLSGLPRHGEAVRAVGRGVGLRRQPRECLEVEAQLTNVVGTLKHERPRMVRDI